MNELSLSLPGINQLDLDSTEVRLLAPHEGEPISEGYGHDHEGAYALCIRVVHRGPAPGGLR